MRHFYLLFLLIFLLPGCDEDPDNTKLFTLLDPDKTNIQFSNQLDADDSLNIIKYLYYYNGGGVAVGDINNDGLKDLYFTGNRVRNKLFLNLGNMVFDDISQKAGVEGLDGWTTGVTMADVNADGYLDIYVSHLGGYKGIKGRNQLFINNGDLTFTDKAPEYGLDLVTYSTQGLFFDFDNDGDLDLYQLNHSVHSRRSYGSASLRFKKDSLAGDLLLRNDFGSDGPRFVDITQQSGIYSSNIGYGLGIAAGDINHDGCIDLYIGNDFHENDYLYINNCDGTFTEKLEQLLGHTSRFSMGNDLADFNNDGLLDIMGLDMLPQKNSILMKSAGEDSYEIYNIKLGFGYHHQLARNTLQVNRGNGYFSEVALLAGVYATDWSWATLFCDLDNDGLKDIYVSNGMFKRPNDLDYINYYANQELSNHSGLKQDSMDQNLIRKMPSEKIANFAFKNEGAFSFVDVTREWGLDQPVFSNGSVYADLDNDGDQDLVLNNLNQKAWIYRNNANTLTDHNYLRITLKGSGNNTFGIGAKVRIKTKGTMQYQELMPTRGYQSSVDANLVFGLGTSNIIDTIEIIWPNAQYQVLTKIVANQNITVFQEEADLRYSYTAPVNKHTYFEDVSAHFNLSHKHHENAFEDYHREYLMPHKLSTQGPMLAAADINGDGWEDFFVGGASGQPSQIFLQGPQGKFQARAIEAFHLHHPAEDVGAEFFDADGDGDLDLYVVSGGNQYGNKIPIMWDRLYLNDGDAGFTHSRDAIPPLFSNGSCVTAGDYDDDGDMDLFVGSRSVVGSYGLSPVNYILENNGEAKFRDVTKEVAPELIDAGMVTDAIWSDFNQDQLLDLILVGEWMPITILKNIGGKLELLKEPAFLDKSNGWWNTIEQGDFDGDGDLDYVAGNWGINSKLKASEQEPVTLYLKDFDNNGSYDPIICYYRNGQNIPFATLDELVKQLTFLKKKFTSYQDYARAETIHDILDPELIENAIVKQAYTFSSSYIENLGNETFRLTPLPIEAQFSPVFGMLVDDFNQDGHLDILLGGNFMGSNISLGLNDASYGLLLKGDGTGNFRPASYGESGWLLKGEIRDLKLIQLADGQKMILVARNNQSLQIFSWNEKAIP